MAASGAAPPDLLSRTNTDPVRVEVTVQVAIERLHQIRP
jgi:hypothetical protein